MGEVNVDFGAGDAGEDAARHYRLIPEGVYLARVWSVREAKSKASGNPMLAIDFKIEQPGYDKRHVWDNFSLQRQALWRLSKFMQVLGLDHEGAVKIDLEEDLIGKSVFVVLQHKTLLQGKLREEVTEYREAEQSEMDPLADSGEPGGDVPF